MTEVDYGVAGKRVLVTGGASGMGAGIVRAFPGLGAKVFSVDLNEADGAAIAKEAGAGFAVCDVTSSQSVSAAVQAAVDTLGGLDVLIHAAGVAPGSPAADASLDTWNLALAVNATGTFLTNTAVFAHLKEHGGRIINFASAAGIKGYPGKPAYAAAKGAVVAWTRTIAVEWAPYGILANAISPGIWTPMYDKTRASMTPEQLAAHDETMKTAVPLGGKLGDIDRDLVPVAAFLSGPGAGFLTGQIFAVDGGSTMLR